MDSLILNSVFCNDKSDDYAAVKKRLNKEIPEPTLKCINDEDKIKSKVGLITADEILLSGALYSKPIKNNLTYIYNNTYFWTMSPSSQNYTLYYYLDTLSLREGNTTLYAEARPVITLSANALVKADFLSESDPGTIDNPYKVIIK